MSSRAELREGWRLFLPYAREVVTLRRRVTLLILAPLVSIVVAAGSRVAVGSAGDRFRPTLLALALGLFAGSVLCWILPLVWRPRLDNQGRFTSRAWAYEVRAEGAEREIRAAFAEGREPAVPVSQRLGAADAARRAKRIWPRWILGSIGGATIFVPYVLFIVAAWPNFAAFGGVVSVLVAWWSVPSGLIALARTTAPIETAPEVPPDLREDGRKLPQPRKVLGTDHPDDYA